MNFKVTAILPFSLKIYAPNSRRTIRHEHLDDFLEFALMKHHLVFVQHRLFLAPGARTLLCALPVIHDFEKVKLTDA